MRSSDCGTWVLIRPFPEPPKPDAARPLWAGGVSVAGLPSKRLGLFAAAGGALIVRSDSNGEDLESFAGAGALPGLGVCVI